MFLGWVGRGFFILSFADPFGEALGGVGLYLENFEISLYSWIIFIFLVYKVLCLCVYGLYVTGGLKRTYFF